MKYIIHLTKYVHSPRGFNYRPKIIDKRIEINNLDNNICAARDEALRLHPGFQVNCIWPEYTPQVKSFGFQESLNEFLRCFPPRIRI